MGQQAVIHGALSETEILQLASVIPSYLHVHIPVPCVPISFSTPMARVFLRHLFQLWARAGLVVCAERVLLLWLCCCPGSTVRPVLSRGSASSCGWPSSGSHPGTRSCTS